MSIRNFYEKNVKDANLLGEFLTNYRLPHTDRNGTPLEVGDEVVCGCGRCGDSGVNGKCKCNPRKCSWIVGERGIVMKLGVYSRAGECEGHVLQMDGGITVAPIGCVLKESR